MNPKSINKDVAYTSIARFSSLVFTFIYSILIIRLLGAEGNGVFSFLVVNAQVSLLFLGLNASSGLGYYTAKGEFSQSTIMGFVFCLFGGALLAVVLVSFFLFFNQSGALSILLPLGYQGVFFLLFFLFSFLTNAIVQICTSYALGNLKHKIYNQFTFLSAFAKVLFMGIYYGASLMGILPGKIEYILFLFIVIELASSFIFLIYLRLRYPFQLSFYFPYNSFIKPFLIYSLKGWVLGLLRFFSTRFFNWVVTFYQGLKALGYMALAVGLFINVEMLIRPIQTALFPYLIKLPIEEGKKRFLFFLRLTNTAAIAISVGVYFLSPFFIPLIFGEEFIASVYVTQIIFLSLPFLSIRGMGAAYTSSRNKHQLIIVAEIIAFMFTIFADLIFIPQYGISAAAWVMVIAMAISSLLISYLVITRLDIPLHKNLIITGKDLSLIWNIVREKSRKILR